MPSPKRKSFFHEDKDWTRIGESVMLVLEHEGPNRRHGITFEDYKEVWKKVLELAGFEEPGELMGYVPVFESKSYSPEDIARAKQMNAFIAEVASIHRTHEGNDAYWDDMDAMWECIQKQKEKNKK